MEKRNFGNTGLAVSRLTFGCGAVGGLMTKGDAGDQDRAIAWARDHGINFFRYGGKLWQWRWFGGQHKSRARQ